jgi:hypothetical protein
MSGTKHHRDHFRLGPVTDGYSGRLEGKDTSDQERVYHYAQLRTAVKHLMPENARLKKQIEALRKENAILQKRLASRSAVKP